MKRVTLDAPGKNALGTELITWIRRQVAEGAGEGLLITGTGDSFSAGLDLREVASHDRAGMEVFLRNLEQMLLELFLYPGPTVALVNGHAIAGGCLLAIACDQRIAVRSPRSRIGLNEVALDLRFPPVVLELARSRIAKVETVVLGSKLHDPDAALALGIVDEVLDEGLAADRAEQLLKYLESLPRSAYAAAKRDLRAAAVRPDPDRDRAFLDEVLPVWSSDALKARIRKMLER